MAVHAGKDPNVFRRSYGTWVVGEPSTTIPLSGFGNIILYDYKIKVEILNIQIIRSKAQITNGVSEILLNWKGIPQTDNAVGEDMTYSLWRHSVYAISLIKEWMEWKININVNPLDYVGFFMD